MLACSQSNVAQAAESGACSHELLVGTEYLGNTEITVISADSAFGGIYGRASQSQLRDRFPHIALHLLVGASHDLHRDRAETFAKLITAEAMILDGTM
jgi:hypothetical protein